MKVSNDIYYVGVNDHDIDLFEGQYDVPKGMSYNSYIILDEKIAIMDTVDKNFTHTWLDNIQEVLKGKEPNYLIVQHMEPDHSANIINLLKMYPNTTVVGNAKTFSMIKQFFGKEPEKTLVVKDGDTLSLGKHTLTFVFAPMVHWPEVMVTYDSFDKVLFSADGFGKFGALDVEDEWVDEARRYYIGIVGKYGQQVQILLKKAASLDIKTICPLHGPVLNENLEYYLNLYNTWSSYSVEDDGVIIAYTSIYGNTKKAVLKLEEKLKARGCPKVVVMDLARVDMAKAISESFKYSKLVLATTTYNASIFPYMNTFINHLVERNFQKRSIAFIENGTWAPMAAKIMKDKFANCKDLEFVQPVVTIKSALDETSEDALDKLADALSSEYQVNTEDDNKQNLSALFNIGYGLYVVTSNDGKKDNGLIVNAISQLTDNPLRVAVTINKENYSHHVIKQTGIMNVNCLTEEAPFQVFENFGFVSGRNVDKFKNITPLRSDNGLLYLPKYINSYMSLKVEEYIDLGTHGLFICSVKEARVISDKPTMTYTYYQNNVKPKPNVQNKKGFVCKICGYVYEGDELPEDFICPLCKHGANDFEKI